MTGNVAAGLRTGRVASAEVEKKTVGPASLPAPAGTEARPTLLAGGFFLKLASRGRRGALAVLALLFAMTGGRAAPARAQSIVPPAAQPVMPDAVIELWEQHWTLNADSSTVYHEKKHVRLNNDRAYGEFGDLRITYNGDTDQLDILVAHVKRPDGTYVELPPYAKVEAGPDAAVGWPAFANLHQRLLVMSGIEPGCVVELEYKITSRPGARPFAADVRLDHRYPIRSRTVAITCPASTPVKPVLTGLPDNQIELAHKVAAEKERAEGTQRWGFTDLPANPDEPQSLPWQIRCPRFAFNVDSVGQWMNNHLSQIDAAADKSEMLTKLATEWTKDKPSASDKLRAIQEKLAATFNFVEFPVDWRPAKLRRASEVIQCNYGLPEEATALLLALARATGLSVRAAILVPEGLWLADAPHDAQVAAYVVVAPGSEGAVHDKKLSPTDLRQALSPPLEELESVNVWEPRRGRIVRDTHWAELRLFSISDNALRLTPIPKWQDAGESQSDLVGKVTLKDDGTLAGDLTLRETGLFVSPESLRTNDGQKGRIGALLGRVLPDLTVESFSVKTLSSNTFEAEGKIKSSKPLKKLADRHCLQLAQDGPFLADVPMPLTFSERKTPVRLTGAFDEQIELTIEWPEKWTVEAQPSDLAKVAGDWGEVEQSVALDKHSLTLRRHTRVNQRDVSPADFLTLRTPLNELRSEHARTLLLKP